MNYPRAFLIAALLLAIPATAAQAQVPEKEVDESLKADLKLYQGSWELLHRDEGDGPTVRSVKTVKGNRSTVRRYSIATGELQYEHTARFKLTQSGPVRVLTFHLGDSGGSGLSYAYQITENDFFEVLGLLQSDDFNGYGKMPTVYHWKRIDDEETDSAE